MRVQFLKTHTGERYGYAAGQVVEVVEEGHGAGHIPMSLAAELLDAGTVVELPEGEAPATPAAE